MTDLATSPSKPIQTRRAPVLDWHQRPGDNDLWYARFLRYLALGPGRSVSLVATGERNHYPVPAHWPAKAKQQDWKARAQAFDEAAKTDPAFIKKINETLAAVAVSTAALRGESFKNETAALKATLAAGGYHAPPEEETYEDEPPPTR